MGHSEIVDRHNAAATRPALVFVVSSMLAMGLSLTIPAIITHRMNLSLVDSGQGYLMERTRPPRPGRHPNRVMVSDPSSATLDTHAEIG